MDAPVATDLLSGCWVILGGSTVGKKRQFDRYAANYVVVTFFGERGITHAEL